MSTINIRAIHDAVMHLAVMTGKKQHIEIQFSASFYSHREGVSLKWKGYMEGVGHVGIHGDKCSSLEQVTEELKVKFDPETLLAKAAELELQAIELRALAGGYK